MKRFTETEKWDDAWFAALSLRDKLLFQWLCDKCGRSGIIEPNWKLASFHLDGPVSEKDLSPAFTGKVVKLDDKKFFIVNFIKIQYPKLSRNCRFHDGIFEDIERFKLEKYLPPGTVPPAKELTLPKGDHGFAEIPSLKELTDYGAGIGASPDLCKKFFKWHNDKNAWVNGAGRLINWKDTLATWRDRERSTPNGKGSTTPASHGQVIADRIHTERQIEILKTRLLENICHPDSLNNGTRPPTEAEKVEFGIFKKQLRNLENQLAGIPTNATPTTKSETTQTQPAAQQ